MLGGLVVVHADRKITRFQTQKTGALLAYLALHPGKSHAREAVAEILWPEGDPIAIRNRLNQAISSLRRQLHPPELGPGSVLVTDHHSLAINSQTVTTDVDEFERLVKAADRSESDSEKIQHLSQAVDLYRGELLEGFYEEWIFNKRMHLGDLYDKSLQQLVRSHVAVGSPEGAVEYARRRLLLDPYDESAHVVLMRLYLRSGRPKLALKQYEDLVRAFEQYDDEPSEYAEKYRLRAEALVNDQTAEIDIEDTFDADSAKRSQEAPPPKEKLYSNLPRVVTSFVGRTEELEQVVSQIRQGRSRLVTILGLGGFGKTRLAIEAGWALSETFDSKVFFVSLANSSELSDVFHELARLLLIESEGRSENDQAAVTRRLSELGPTLVIIDNFEHLATDESCRIISELLESISSLSLIVTSRLPLRIGSETVVQLSPLELPDADETDLKVIAASPTVALFVDRAQAVKADFQLTERTAQAIVDLVRKLEGLPLALELAASWARVLTPGQMLERFEDNIDQLESRRRDANPRHRTLRASFDGSFALLDSAQKELFLQLTVFSGGWDLSAAEAVAQKPDLIEEMQALEERSLIYPAPTEASIRFDMLGTIRQFGQSLLSDPDRDELRSRHAKYLLALVHRAGTFEEWSESISVNYSNCLEAMRWFEANGRYDDFADMASSLGRYWEGKSLISEGVSWMDRVLEIDPALSPETKAGTWIAMGSLMWFGGAFAESVDFLRRGRRLAQDLARPELEIRALFALQLESHRVGSYAEAKSHLADILRLAKQIDDKGSAARAYMAMGNAFLEEEDFGESQRHYELGLEVSRQTGDVNRVGPILTNLASLAVYQHRLDAALTWIQEAEALAKASSHRWLKSMCGIVKGRIEIELHEYEKAANTLIAAYRLSPNEKLVAWRFLLHFGFALLGLGFTNDALRIFGLGNAVRDRIGERHQGIEMRMYEARLAEASKGMNTSVFEEQFAIGRNMTLADVEPVIAKVQRSF